jgi:K+-transporting ATPase ATPase C chain
MRDHFVPAFRAIVILSVLTGIAYPLAVTGIAQTVFPRQANGSLIERDGIVIGSALIGQPFGDPGYFWSRPSATPDQPYNGAASQGSNLGPTSDALRDSVEARVASLRAFRVPEGPVPVDLVTSSASGLDPHISPAAALYQVQRVAATRGFTDERVRSLVESFIEGRSLGVLGEPVVNVLRLNLALDELTR